MPRNLTYTDEALTRAVATNISIAGVLRSLGIRQAGGSHAHMGRRIRGLGLDTSHFRGQAHNTGIHRVRLTAVEILVRNSPDAPRRKPGLLRRALIELGIPHECSDCHTPPTWRGKDLILHVDHIDGDYANCTLANLRFLCPNCHSQTETFCRKSPTTRDTGLP